MRVNPIPSPPSLTETTPQTEDEIILSGWGDVDDTREDLFKEWKQMLDEWDGTDKDKPKPSKLIKLCSKVGHCTNLQLY